MSYIALEKVRHNGSSFNVGEEVTGLEKQEAKRLLELGVIEGEDPKPKKQVSGNGGADV